MHRRQILTGSVAIAVCAVGVLAIIVARSHGDAKPRAASKIPKATTALRPPERFLIRPGPAAGEVDVVYVTGPVPHSPYYKLLLRTADSWTPRYLLSGGSFLSRAHVQPISTGGGFNYQSIAQVSRVDRLRIPSSVHGRIMICSVEDASNCGTLNIQ